MEGCQPNIPGPSPKVRRYAKDWAERGRKSFLGEQGLLTKQDNRFFAYPHSNTNLTEVWPRYNESRDTRRRRKDPSQVFSANEFCLGDVAKHDDELVELLTNNSSAVYYSVHYCQWWLYCMMYACMYVFVPALSKLLLPTY